MRRPLYLSALAALVTLVLAPSALAQDQYEEEAVPEIQEELAEDPQEPVAENVAEGQREAMLEEQVEARQGTDLSPRQEAALERQAEAGNQQPKELPKEKGEAKVEEEKMKEAKKDLPKTGGVSTSAPRCWGWAPVSCSSEEGCWSSSGLTRKYLGGEGECVTLPRAPVILPLPVQVTSVQALRFLGEGLHRLLHLPPMGPVQHHAQDLLDPHRYLPAYPLVALGSPTLGIRLVCCEAGAT